jgi:hypothetical protein
MSNSLPPPGAIGIEKLLAYAGAAVMVALVQPQAWESLTSLFESGADLQQLLETLKAAW